MLKQLGIDNKVVGLIGCTKGGEATLLIASCIHKVKVVVGIVSASNVYQYLDLI
ncbi:acyl-CoA thioester hydrolase/BAAT C-terminal domain-containing protein [Pseudobacteroides cellulosolvens]|uniref:acyl-CoA thioester hydrolase/BAAT C-terminal domain-containing protein n=1 Tax=Pseudobacteroides cellulosolvens TaxID=35825 RepID=UPI00390889FF